MKKNRKWLRALEITLAAAAILLLGTYAAATFHRATGRSAVREFDAARARLKALEKEEPPQLSWPSSRVDFTLWSEKRVLAYKETLVKPQGGPMAVLAVPRFNIRAAVLEGTDEFALNRGVGWISGTARPGQPGNIGIAGHRDGFFRPLKDIREGDEIRLETLAGDMAYRVDQIEIVKPDDVSVLRKRHADSLTLVTCYPFYFVGDAPQRFIVHAVRQPDAAAGPKL